MLNSVYDFSGLAEAGLITSKLSNRDLFNDIEGTLLFSPERYIYTTGNSSISSMFFRFLYTLLTVSVDNPLLVRLA